MTDTLAPAVDSFPATASAPEAAPQPGLLASWFAVLSEDDTASYRYLLVLRFLVLNLVAAALLGAACLKGWVGVVFLSDSTQLVAVISIVFAYGLFNCGRKIVQTSIDINQLKEPFGGAFGRWPEATSAAADRLDEADARVSARVARYLRAMQGRDGQSRALSASTLKLRLGARISSIRHVANSLVFLGLIGTVIGFIIALSGIDPTAAADVDSIGPMVSTLISGMSVALYTTLVGAILNIWLMVNYRLLESGTITLLTTIVELGEHHARP